MRMVIIIAALSGLALVEPIHAQTTDQQLSPIAPPAPETLPDQTVPDQSFSEFTDVAIVAVEDLPPEIKAQAEAVITQTSADDLLRLQSSIDASPQAMSALAALGLNSSQVVAANIDGDGILTLIIQPTT